MPPEKLNPSLITGFTDGDGCFHVSVRKNKKLKLEWRVELVFEINLNEKDIALLEQIQNYFKVGSINKTHGPHSNQFQVRSFKDLNVIINHFYKYPLITDKCYYFKLFKQAFHLTERQSHLTLEGFSKIVAIKAAMNRGLSDVLK